MAETITAELEREVVWMTEMMLAPDELPNRLAFVNRFEEVSKRLGHDRAVAAMDEASRRCERITGPVEAEATP